MKGISPVLLLFYKPHPSVIDELSSKYIRYTARQIVNHSFLLVEPEFVLLSMDPEKVNLSLQLVFKGMDKLSVKFNFNIVKDTAEEVVGEMVSLRVE